MRKLLLAVFLSLAMVAAAPTHLMAQADLPSVAQEALALFRQGDYSEALVAAEKWIDLTPADLRAYGMATNIAVFARDGERAVSIAKKAVGLAPENPTVRANLVLAFQFTGRTSEADRERSVLYGLRNAIADPSRRPPVFIRDSFDHDGKRILAREFFELQGPRAVKYAFDVQELSGPFMYRISFGSYEFTNRVARETGQIREGERLYHLDRYFPGNKHETLGFFASELPYEEVKRLASDAISGRRAPISSSQR